MDNFTRQYINSLSEEEIEKYYPFAIWVKLNDQGKYTPCLHTDQKVMGYLSEHKRKTGISQQDLIDNPEDFNKNIVFVFDLDTIKVDEIE